MPTSGVSRPGHGHMKKRKLLLWVMLVVLTGCGCMVWLRREPTYQGKTLQEWVVAGNEYTNDPATAARAGAK